MSNVRSCNTINNCHIFLKFAKYRDLTFVYQTLAMENRTKRKNSLLYSVFLIILQNCRKMLEAI